MRVAERNRRRVIWILAAVVVLLLLIYLLVPKPPVVRVSEVFRDDLLLPLSTTGVAEGDVVDVSSRIAGEVVQIYVDEGDRVTQGQVIAQLETSELQSNVDNNRAAVASAQAQVQAAVSSLTAETQRVNAEIARAMAAVSAARARLAELQAGARAQEIRQARAEVQQFEAQARNARTEAARAEQLFRSGAISRRQLDDARTTAQVAEANLRAARERLALLEAGARSEQIAAARAEVQSAEAVLSQAFAGRQVLQTRQEEVRAARAQADQALAALQAAETRLSYATIRSPIPGSVVRKHVEAGETVSPQQAIITVSRSNRVWITAEVDQEDVAAIAEGQRVRVSLSAFPGRYAIGTVTDVSEVAVPRDVGRVRARVVRARIDLEETNLPFRPGTEVNIDGELQVADNAVLVPNDAVLRVGDSDQVFVITGNVVDRREIVAGLSNFDYTIVRSGVEPGEMVAVSNLDELSDGERIRVER